MVKYFLFDYIFRLMVFSFSIEKRIMVILYSSSSSVLIKIGSGNGLEEVIKKLQKGILKRQLIKCLLRK